MIATAVSVAVLQVAVSSARSRLRLHQFKLWSGCLPLSVATSTMGLIVNATARRFMHDSRGVITEPRSKH